MIGVKPLSRYLERKVCPGALSFLLTGLLVTFFSSGLFCVQKKRPETGRDTGGKKIIFWYGRHQKFGHLGEPQRWINILGHVSGPAQTEKVTFSLNKGPESPLTLGSDLHRLARAGDFNVELAWDNVKTGPNTLVISARSKEGNRHTASVILDVYRGKTRPFPCRVNFRDVKNLQDVVQIVDGHWRLVPDGVRTVTPYYDRVLSLGDTTWTDYQATIHLTIHDFTPPEPGPPTYNVSHFGVAQRWRGHHADGRQPSRRWYPLGAQGEFLLKTDLQDCRWRILFDSGSEKPPLYAKKRKNLVLGAPVWVKSQVVTLSGGRTRYRYKLWADNGPEPGGWDVEGLESNDYPGGSLCLVPHNSDVTIHEVFVGPVE